MPRNSAFAVAHDKRRYRVTESGCWLWTGGKYRSGHAMVKIGGSTLLAHRVFYQVHVGPIPPGHIVHHECNEPACVRPDHLRAVTRAEHEAIHKRTKLNLGAVAQIKQLKKAGVSQRDIAKRFSVHESTVSLAVRNLTWRTEFSRAVA